MMKIHLHELRPPRPPKSEIARASRPRSNESTTEETRDRVHTRKCARKRGRGVENAYPNCKFASGINTRQIQDLETG